MPSYSPFKTSVSALAAGLIFMGAGTVAVAGCRPRDPQPPQTEKHSETEAATLVASTQTAAASTGKADYAKANELGLIPVLEYHRFGPVEERWTRTYDNFRKDLQWLHASGYVLVNMRDVAERKIDIPAGKKPVVLTFDDSTIGQFRYLTDAKGAIQRDAAGKPKIDPNSAIGILDLFAKQHPDFGTAGTFYVLPSAFEQPAGIKEKFNYLVDTGREIGSHTWGHDNLSTLNAAQVSRSLTKLQAFINTQLGKPYAVKTLALPYGIGPKSDAALAAVVKGGSGDTSYHHRALLLVGANPATSPYAKGYKPTAVARIQAIDSEFRNWFNRKPGVTTRTTEPWAPYVSDGDATKVSFPASAKSKFNPASLLPGQSANPVDPKKAGAAVASAQAGPAPAAGAQASSEQPSAAAVSEAAAAEMPQLSAQTTAHESPEAAPSPAAKPAALDHHPGYGKKLPEGGSYVDGKVFHTVKPGDSVEAIAYRYVKFTTAYTYPSLASAIRKANGGARPLRIGERLEIPQIRQAPPRPRMVPKPKNFNAKGIYVTGTTAGSDLVWKLVDNLKAQGGNTVVFDAKDMSGVISYNTAVPLAKEIKAYGGGMITDLPKFIERLHAKDIHVVARLTLFHDAKLANRKPQHALRSKRTGAPWKENGHLLWADPSDTTVQDYNLAIAKELIANGVDEIQYDYVRFPAQGDTPDIKWKTIGTQPLKKDVITAWVKRAYEALHPTGVLVSADVYGVVAWDQGIDVRITGQNLTEMAPHLDAVSPMLYPSHFYGTFDKKSYPPDHPAYFVGEGVKRVGAKTEGSNVTIRPWIQAFPYRIRNYGPDYVTVQLKASNSNGGNGWLLWNAENDYRVGMAGVAKLKK